MTPRDPHGPTSIWRWVLVGLAAFWTAAALLAARLLGWGAFA